MPHIASTGISLREAPILQDLPQPLIQHIERHGTPWAAANGQLLFQKGDPEHFIAFILRGSVHAALYDSEGREVILDTASCGSLIGETALLMPAQRPHSAQLSPDARLLLLGIRHCEPLQACALFMQRIQQQLCHRLQSLNHFVESTCLYRLETRLARHLLQQMARHGETRDDGILVPLPFSQSVLAAMLNASRSRLNAQLQEWQRQGLIQPQRMALTIKNPARLRQIAECQNQIN